MVPPLVTRTLSAPSLHSIPVRPVSFSRSARSRIICWSMRLLADLPSLSFGAEAMGYSLLCLNRLVVSGSAHIGQRFERQHIALRSQAAVHARGRREKEGKIGKA